MRVKNALLLSVALCAAAAAGGAGTLFENWSDETASARIDADGARGWIRAAPEKGEKRGRYLGGFGSKLSDLSKVKLGGRWGHTPRNACKWGFSRG